MRARVLVAPVALGIAFCGVLAAACGTDDFTIPSPNDAAVDAHPDASTGTGGDSSTTDATAALLVNGGACGAGAACASGHCVDGVCCDTACDGTCESCAGTTPGTCAPIPDGTDPDTECQPANGGANDFDASAPFALPDGGLPPTTANQCAGHCNGSRACSFTAAGTTCGTTFCGNTSEEGVATCDGAGRCLYGVQDCGTFVCSNGTGGCKTACATTDDCLRTNYCDPQTKACTPKSADGAACTTDDQCTTGTCTTFYRDLDGDGYGDIKATVANGGAKMACGTIVPTGYSATNDDCFDSRTAVAKLVNPGQTDFFDAPYSPGPGAAPSFDYDCSGIEDKETAENATCGFCNRSLIQPQITPIGICRFQTTCTTMGQATGHSCTGCAANDAPEFAGTVDCGASAKTITCQSCAVVGDPATAVQGDTVTQACH